MKHADKSKRTRNLCNAAMLCCAAAVLLTGLGRTLLRPKDVNYTKTARPTPSPR